MEGREVSVRFGKGFSCEKLRNFRQFYLTYPAREICYTLCRELIWGQDRLIMRVEHPKARAYYLQESSGALSPQRSGTYEFRAVAENVARYPPCIVTCARGEGVQGANEREPIWRS